MRAILLVPFLTCALVQPVIADAMANLYAKTVMIQDTGTGEVSALTINSDHSYTVVETQNGKPVRVSGIWALQPDNVTVCLTLKSTNAYPTAATSGCLVLAGEAPGASWTAKNDQNQTLSLTLLPAQ